MIAVRDENKEQEQAAQRCYGRTMKSIRAIGDIYLENYPGILNIIFSVLSIYYTFDVYSAVCWKTLIS